MINACLLHEYNQPWKPYIKKQHASSIGNAKKSFAQALLWTDADLDKAAGLICKP